MAHVAEWKKQEVAEICGLLLKYPVVGIVDMRGIPAKQLQKMRASMRGEVLIKMSRKSLMKHAIEKASKEEKSLSKLTPIIDGQAAFIFSKLNPFRLSKALEKNKTPAAAKPNSIAPKDIVIQKGETPFPPGPALAQLQQVGVSTTIKNGKIFVKEDTVVAKEGGKIKQNLADLMGKLGIEPLETGLNLLAAFEEGTVFLPEVLSIDSSKVLSSVQTAYRSAVALSLNSGFMTKETAPLAISKAHMDAVSIAISANIFEPEVMDIILSKANLQMLALASLLADEALDDELIGMKPKQKKPTAKAKGGKKEKVKEEEKTEDEAMEGLGSLFG